MRPITSILLAGALALTLAMPPLQAQIEFGIPTPMPAPFNIGGVYGYEWVSPDGLDIYFSSNFENPDDIGGAFDIYKSHRPSLTAAWQSFEKLPATINTPERTEGAPSFTADGQQLYFMRVGSPFGLPEGDLFVSNKLPDGSWGEAQPLAFNTPEGSEALPTISPDGLTLYFNTYVSNAYPHPPETTSMFENMYVAHRQSTADPFGPAEYFFGGYGIVTPDGLKHIFMGYNDVANYYGLPRVNEDADLYIRTRDSVDLDWGPAQLLYPPLSSSGLDCCSFFSAADSTLYFVSTRPGTDATGFLGFVDMWQATLADAISLDIKPGSYPNPINLKSKGLLPVAVLSTENFDATLIDVETLLFGDPLLIADGKSPVSPTKESYEDVNYDGLMDLTLKFSMQDLLANQVIGAATMQGYLAGELYDGTVIAGRDMVVIVPAITAIPEPSSLLLLMGFAVLTSCRRK